MSPKFDVLITSGDNKHDLIAQLIDWGRTNMRHRQPFTIKIRLARPASEEIEVKVFIRGITTADDKGINWVITGEITMDSLIRAEFPWYSYGWVKEMRFFKANYNIRDRQGLIEPSPKINPPIIRRSM